MKGQPARFHNQADLVIVTVPAGTFEALKIEQKASVVMNGQEFHTQGMMWYVKGVGYVKGETSAMGSDPVLTQLVSYDTP